MVRKHSMPLYFAILFFLMAVIALVPDIQLIQLSLNDVGWKNAMNVIHWNIAVKNFDYGAFFVHIGFIIIGIFIIINRDWKIPKKDGD